jgi:Ca2+-binding RTX toxin-like protein
VLGDHGYVDWAAGDLGRRAEPSAKGYDVPWAGDDENPLDIDRIVSTDIRYGGADTITTGDGDDIVLGGADGSQVVKQADGHLDSADSRRHVQGDTIDAGNGRNIVFGDSGAVLAAVRDESRWGGLPITVGLIVTLGPAYDGWATDWGGSDIIRTGTGNDVILGGARGDTITSAGGNNVVFGDHGLLSWTPADGWPLPPQGGHTNRSLTTTPGFDHDPSDLDWAVSTYSVWGGADTITTGGGHDIVIGGAAGDVISSGAGNDLVFGDFAELLASLAGQIDGRDLPLTPSNATDPSYPFTFTSVFTQDVDLGGNGGNDLVHAGAGDDIVFGGQGDDTIFGEAGDDDLVGGHNVSLGQDGKDQIDGGAGNDVVAGDNAIVLRLAAAAIDRRFTTVPGAMYDADGKLAFTPSAQADPLGRAVRRVLLLDHTQTIERTDPTVWGNRLPGRRPGRRPAVRPARQRHPPRRRRHDDQRQPRDHQPGYRHARVPHLHRGPGRVSGRRPRRDQRPGWAGHRRRRLHRGRRRQGRRLRWPRSRRHHRR